MSTKSAGITVQKGATLKIQGSHLYSCEDMWEGIKVEPGGILQITGTETHSSFIEDAIVAVYFNMGFSNPDIINGYFLSVDNTIFNRNNISIKIENYYGKPNPENEANDYPFYVKNTIFTSRNIQFQSGSMVWDDVEKVKNLDCIFVIRYPLTPDGMSGPYISEKLYPSTNIASFMKPPFSGLKPTAGIMLNHVGYTDNRTNNIPGIKVGYSKQEPEITNQDLIHFSKGQTYNTNVFDNMADFGIAAINSNLTVVNCTFQNAFYQPVSMGDEDFRDSYQIGIYAGNIGERLYRLSVIRENENQSLTNAFFNQVYAVKSDFYFNNTITDAEIRSTQQMTNDKGAGHNGLYIQTDRIGSVDINRNIINNIYYPINFVYLSGIYGDLYNGSVNVNENKIGACGEFSERDRCTGKEGVYTAINLISGVTSEKLAKFELNCNRNKIYESYNGIYASNWNMKYTIFDNNPIYIKKDPSGAEQYGIHVDAGISNESLTSRVTNNVITGDGGIYETAIDLNSNIGLNVGCNTVYKVANGIRFSGNTNFTNKCWDNTFDATGSYNMNGLTMDNVNGSDIDMTGKITGNVCTADNQWVGDWDYTNNPPFVYNNFKTYCLNGTDATSIPMNVQNSPVYNPDDSYKNTNNPNDVAYNVNYGSIFVMQQGNCIHDCNNTGGRKAKTSFSGYNIGTKAKGGNNNGLNFGGGSRSVANLESIALGQVAISTSDSAQRIFVMQQQLYSSLLADTGLQNSSSILQTFLDSARQGSLGTINLLDSLFASGNIAAAKSKTAGWIPQNNVEVNYYHYYYWLLAMADTNSGLSRQDTTDIFTLALGCPQTDGKVVFAARNLFSNLTHQYFNYPNTCGYPGNYRLANNKIVKKKVVKEEETILVYPNPTSGMINIQLPLKGNWLINISDITGRVLWNQECKGCSGTIKHLIEGAKGLYFIKIIDKTTGQQNLKKINLQ